MTGMMEAVRWGAVGAAGFGAGAINAVAGGGSLVSYPALVALGYPPIQANVTNTVASLPGYVGGSVGYRREIAAQRQRLAPLGLVSVLGAGIGSALLLLGSDRTFSAVVPWLVLGSVVLMAVQPLVVRRLGGNRSAWGLYLGQLLVGVYGGYFNAGLGIMMLAVLGVFIAEDLQRINALKGAMSALIALVSLVVFALLADVAWLAAAVMSVTGLIGGRVGVLLARRIPSHVLRWCVVGFGLVVAIYLWGKDAA